MAFVSAKSVETDEWRSIILFGLNVATYKFALAKSLIELGRDEQEVVSLEDLAVPFAKHLCQHLDEVDTQGTFRHSRFLDACRFYNAGKIQHDELITATALLGFVNVIDAFHHLRGADTSTRFFIDERKTSNGGIRLTDTLLQLAHSTESHNYFSEIEARWRLVETAWESRRAGDPMTVLYDSPRELLVPALLGKRKPIAEVRPALNGYQKGHCFYCYRPILIVPDSSDPADVDHFFPHVLMSRGLPVDLDGVWNLVLACQECNRGTGGKMAAVPAVEYLEHLRLRNEYLIWSHHPLRDTLMASTGDNPANRRRFLRTVWDMTAESSVRTDWRPPDRGRSVLG
jgi:5-methylcytosine-specific restriction endonuclease McrA